MILVAIPAVYAENAPLGDVVDLPCGGDPLNQTPETALLSCTD